MSSSNYLPQLLGNLASQLPLLLVSVIAAVITLAKWQQGSRGSLWAFLGFALSALLCVVVPIVQLSVQNWVIESSSVAQRSYVFAALGLVWSVLRAATYVFLLVGVFAGRPVVARGPAAPPRAA